MVTTEIGLEVILDNLSNMSNEQLLTLQVSIAQLLQNRIAEQPKEAPVVAISREAATAETIQEMEEMFKDFLSPEEMNEIKQQLESGEPFVDEKPLPKPLAHYIIEDKG
jgi:anti-sigma28 factor (negative regulator of flagellin synthesis)